MNRFAPNNAFKLNDLGDFAVNNAFKLQDFVDFCACLIEQEKKNMKETSDFGRLLARERQKYLNLYQWIWGF